MSGGGGETMGEEMRGFFRLHEGLPRQGPGETADVTWAAEIAGLKPDARICDAGCGPGADVGALLRAAPEGRVLAIDAHAPFIEEARARFALQRRVRFEAGDMAKVEGPFDFIWSAGAIYFLGIETGLRGWRAALAPGGTVAFSEPCLFTDAPSEGAVAFWQGYPRLTDAQGIADQVAAAGYRVLGTRALADVAWESYYRPLEARIAAMKPGADAELAQAIAAEEAEIAGWRAHRAETGYLLVVAAPA